MWQGFWSWCLQNNGNYGYNINQILAPKNVFQPYLCKKEPTKRLKRKQRFVYFRFTLMVASIWQQWLCHMIKHHQGASQLDLGCFLELLPSRSRVNFELFFRSGMVGVWVGVVVTKNVYIWNSRTIWGKLTCHVQCDALIYTERISCRLSVMIRGPTVQLHIHHNDPQTCVAIGDVCLGHREKIKK